MAARESGILAVLTSFPRDGCSSYDSSSDDESEARACAYMLKKLFSPPTKRPKIVGYIEDVVHKYSKQGVPEEIQIATVCVLRPDIRFRGVVVLPGLVL
ncbi:unnamed protein product [Ixodes persulcatus]